MKCDAIPYPRTYAILRPLSIIYSALMDARNFLFDTGLLKSHKFGIPVICIGNICAGGTGKTPHTEFIADLLSKEHKISILSRGYKRASNGFQTVLESSSALEVGDEPLQMKRKFKEVMVCVDESRRHGIDSILAANPNIEIVILDDAMQHRFVCPSFCIALTDYARLYTRDKVLPEGRLRENAKASKRADLIIVTKCPADLDESTANDIIRELNPGPCQKILFTMMRYDSPLPVFEAPKISFDSIRKRPVLAISAIANPAPFETYLQNNFDEVCSLRYPDHHAFTSHDVKEIAERLSSIGSDAIAFTTEKDAVRLKAVTNLSDNLKDNLYMIPIQAEFLFGQESHFKDLITCHINSFHPDGI